MTKSTTVATRIKASHVELFAAMDASRKAERTAMTQLKQAADSFGKTGPQGWTDHPCGAARVLLLAIENSLQFGPMYGLQVTKAAAAFAEECQRSYDNGDDFFCAAESLAKRQREFAARRTERANKANAAAALSMSADIKASNSDRTQIVRDLRRADGTHSPSQQRQLDADARAEGIIDR